MARVMAIRIIETTDPLKDPAVLAVRDRLRAGTGGAAGADIAAAVRRIIEDVAGRGDAALAALTAEFDGAEVSPDGLRVSREQIAEAHQSADGAFLELVRRVAGNIREYQESILVKDPAPVHRGGREMAVRYTPVDRVGVYVPGMRALYPSTVLMTVVPAQVAAVNQIAMVSPPTGGDVNAMVLALAGELGVTEVYRVGGAQAIAALAIGTESIPKVDKIVGPGNAYVTEAKRQMFGRVGIDTIAGPSEVLIVADDTAPPRLVAADMLAQAEHDPGSAVLVTPSAKLGRKVAAEIRTMMGGLERAGAIEKALDDFSAIIIVDGMAAACEVANDFAAEHVQIMTSDDADVLKRIRNAGAIFVGRDTPVPLGDYLAGPSHVLPTGGAARFSGPLSCNEFLKASSIVTYDKASLAEDADDVIDFATREGLTAHANAVRIRREK